jgi:membrane protease YdiL (CAAX protease family)
MLGTTIIVALVAVSSGVWYWMVKRWKAGLTIIPFARRRAVPWLGRDLLFIVLVAVLFLYIASMAVTAITGGADANEIPNKKPQWSHPAEQLLGSGDWRMIVVAEIMAVIVAPVTEEFFFRVLLQGWLEAVWSRQRRKHQRLRTAPFSWIPITLPALLFAGMHLRKSRAPLSLDYLTTVFLGQMPAYLATIAVALVVLRFGVGATAADLGWQPRKLAADAKLALGTLLAAMPPILLLQGTLLATVKRTGIAIAPDPIPLFFLALVFGMLYQRTHRIAPSLLLHMAFNATSVVVFSLGM